MPVQEEIRLAEFVADVTDAGDEQLIRCRRELKFVLEQVQASCTDVEDELRRRIRERGPLATPSGTASLTFRRDRLYDPAKTLGVLGQDYFMRVVKVSSTLVKALFSAEPLLNPGRMHGTYTETETECLVVR